MVQVSSPGLEVLRDTLNTPSREAAKALERWLHSFLVLHPISVSTTANNVGSYLLLVPIILGGLALVHQLWATKFWLIHSRRLAQARYMVPHAMHAFVVFEIFSCALLFIQWRLRIQIAQNFASEDEIRGLHVQVLNYMHLGPFVFWLWWTPLHAVTITCYLACEGATWNGGRNQFNPPIANPAIVNSITLGVPFVTFAAVASLALLARSASSKALHQLITLQDQVARLPETLDEQAAQLVLSQAIAVWQSIVNNSRYLSIAWAICAILGFATLTGLVPGGVLLYWIQRERVRNAKERLQIARQRDFCPVVLTVEKDQNQSEASSPQSLAKALPPSPVARAPPSPRLQAPPSPRSQVPPSPRHRAPSLSRREVLVFSTDTPYGANAQLSTPLLIERPDPMLTALPFLTRAATSASPALAPLPKLPRLESGQIPTQTALSAELTEEPALRAYCWARRQLVFMTIFCVSNFVYGVVFVAAAVYASVTMMRNTKEYPTVPLFQKSTISSTIMLWATVVYATITFCISLLKFVDSSDQQKPPTMRLSSFVRSDAAETQ
ncbi:unnamed protein product [Jaminaea pallidilutea]